MLKYLRLAALAEGVSFLLFAVTVPLKYSLGILWPNKIVGMVHGIVFLAYVALVATVALQFRWKLKTIVLAMIASLLPFGTFVADRYIFSLAGRDN